MELFDERIAEFLNLCDTHDSKQFPVSTTKWPDEGNNNLIFRSDMAYELGGAEYAIGITLITEDPHMCSSDTIELIGNNLYDIEQECDYARVTLIRVRRGVLTEGKGLYNAVKKIEFVRYHINPRGFMTRITKLNHRESARVSRQAIEDGLSFHIIGNQMVEKYHENPDVLAVRQIFITDPGFPYKELAKIETESERITHTLDYVLQSQMTDCAVCSLKKVCEEVEGIRQLHTKLAATGE